MASLFGFPQERLTNVTDTSQHVVTGESFIEKIIFVGGRYDEKHNDIFSLFGYQTTEATRNEALLSTVVQLFSLFPVFIILFCQIGFALLQSGASRMESAAMPFIANMASFATSCLAYWAVGHAFSRSDGFYILGYNNWLSIEFEPKNSPDWLIHLCLAVTTANIASFGGLERCPLLVYCLVAPIVSGVIHSIAVHLAWHPEGWLLTSTAFSSSHYRDFGGSGVVHVVGGAAALTLSMVLGPRYSRIRERKSRIVFNDLDGHSLPSEILGGYLLVVCYTCCNCVRVTTTCLNCHASLEIGRALINTLISASSSCVTTVIVIRILRKVFGNMRVHWPISRQVTNGLMTGIVAVAAGCNVYSHWASSIIGITSSFTYVTWSLALYTTRADDPVGAVAVHLGGGLWGAVCVHLFQNGTGLIYTQEPMKVLLAVVWNFLAALLFAVGSIVVTGLVLALPRAINYIPLNHVQEIEGIDMVCIEQQAYPNGSKVSPFTTDLIEDREGFMDSNPASPMSPESTSLTSPTSYSVSRYQQMCNELQNTNDVSAPYFQFSEKELPTFVLSPGDGDRRVWFSGDSLPDQVAPMTPLIDAYADRWGDVEF